MNTIKREVMPLTSDDLFIILDHPSADFDYPIHYHDAFEINLVMHTSGTRIVGDSIERFQDIDLAMIGPNLPHAWRGDCVEGNHVITIQFSGSLLDMPMFEKRLFAPIKGLMIESKKGLRFSADTAKMVAENVNVLTKMHGFQTVLGIFLPALYSFYIRQILSCQQPL